MKYLYYLLYYITTGHKKLMQESSHDVFRKVYTVYIYTLKLTITYSITFITFLQRYHRNGYFI